MAPIFSLLLPLLLRLLILMTWPPLPPLTTLLSCATCKGSSAILLHAESSPCEQAWWCRGDSYVTFVSAGAGGEMTSNAKGNQ